MFFNSKPLIKESSNKIQAFIEIDQANLLDMAVAISLYSSGLKTNRGFEKLRSCMLFIGTKWICACGTSNPITLIPTLIQGMD